MGLKPAIDVLVVGAGPVGLAAALALARHGQKNVEILDEAERRAGLSYALALHPATLDALDELGVASTVVARGQRVDRVTVHDGADRKATIDLSTLARRHPYLVVLPQSELEAVLLGALADAGVTVRWRHRLRRIDARADAPVRCTIDRIDSEASGYAVAGAGGAVGKSFERDVELVIGADGHASLVRRQLGIEWNPMGPAGTVAVFELEGAALPRDVDATEARRELRLGVRDGLRSIWWPLPSGRMRLGFELPVGAEPTAPRGKTRAPSIVPWLASPLDETRLAELVAEHMPWFGASTGRLMWSASVRFERALASAFGRGRAWLAGDAAHLAFPFGVQSMNEGIAEAIDLAARGDRLLAGSASPADLAAYGDERRSRWVSRFAGAVAGPATPVDPWLADRSAGLVEAMPFTAEEASAMLSRAAVHDGV